MATGKCPSILSVEAGDGLHQGKPKEIFVQTVSLCP